MASKIVIEYQNLDGDWLPANNDMVSLTINNLGTQSCPEVHRHLDELIKNANKHNKNGENFRWRLVDIKPAGRPVRRGEAVRWEDDCLRGVVTGVNDHGEIEYIITHYAGTLKNLWIGVHGHDFIKDLFHLDGTPVSEYDPS